jgi:putative phosphoribosyl transferase
MTGSPPAARYAPRFALSEGPEQGKSSSRSRSQDAPEELRKEVDEIICLSTPSPFLAVGAHYAEFGQLADTDVISLLEERHRRMARSGDGPSG